jgi:hypothetical protein
VQAAGPGARDLGDARRGLVEDLGIEAGRSCRTCSAEPRSGSGARADRMTARARGASQAPGAPAGGRGARGRGGRRCDHRAERRGWRHRLARARLGQIIDPGSQRMLAQVLLAGRPTRLATDGRSVWVAGGESRVVSSIDPRRRTPTRLMPIRALSSALAAGGRRLGPGRQEPLRCEAGLKLPSIGT